MASNSSKQSKKNSNSTSKGNSFIPKQKIPLEISQLSSDWLPVETMEIPLQTPNRSCLLAVTHKQTIFTVIS